MSFEVHLSVQLTQIHNLLVEILRRLDREQSGQQVKQAVSNPWTIPKWLVPWTRPQVVLFIVMIILGSLGHISFEEMVALVKSSPK